MKGSTNLSRLSCLASLAEGIGFATKVIEMSKFPVTP